MSVPGFVIVSDDDDGTSDVHTAVLDESGNQIIVSLDEAANYKPLLVRNGPARGVYMKNSEECKKLVRVHYKCDLCEKLFKVSENLKEHRRTVHQVTSLFDEFPCDQCGIICLNDNQMNLHIYRSHGKVKVDQKIVINRVKSAEEKRKEDLEALVIKDDVIKLCVVAELKALETKTDPKRPRYVSRQRHQCLLCSKNFSTPSMLRRHQSVHTGIKPFPCPYCSKGYSQSEHLQRHIRTAHVERVNTTLTVRRKPLWNICKVCGQRFTAKHRYIEHLKVHVNGLFECHLCDRKFSIKNSLLRHVATHQRQVEYNCGVCSKTFVNLSSFKIHQRIHSGSYPFTCSVCDKGFPKKSRLLEHVEKHFSDLQKVFSCDSCSYVSPDSHSLEEHQQQQHGHTFKSKICEQTTSSSQTPPADDQGGEILSFKCNSCSLTFKESAELAKHCQIFHKFIITNTNGRSMFTCDPCWKSFDSREVLRDHLKIHDSSGALIDSAKNLPAQKIVSLLTYDLAQLGQCEDVSKAPAKTSASENMETNTNSPVIPVQQTAMLNPYIIQEAVSSSTAVMSQEQDETKVPDIPGRHAIPGRSILQTTPGKTELLAPSDREVPMQIQTEILYKIDDSEKLYGISENGTLYEVVTTGNALVANDASTWPPTEQQMESGDLLLDIVSQGGCLPLSVKGDKSDLLQHVVAEKSGTEILADQPQLHNVQAQSIGNIQTIN